MNNQIISDDLTLSQIPQEPLNQMLSAMDLSQLNMMEIVKFIYESTYMRYHIKFHDEKNLRVKYENKIVEQVGKIAHRDKLIDDMLEHYQYDHETPEHRDEYAKFKKVKDGL